ncbi:transposase [Streptomyces sp. Tu 3180]|nr:transposase [Streptomyces sp. Tu 3180]
MDSRSVRGTERGGPHGCDGGFRSTWVEAGTRPPAVPVPRRSRDAGWWRPFAWQGRSRGGSTSKPHLSADGRCRPLSPVVTPGRRADRIRSQAVPDRIRVQRAGTGRPRRKPESLAADEAYSNGPCREYLRRRGVRHTIPERTDSRAAPVRKGSRGGRPPGSDEERYGRQPAGGCRDHR